jgi:hypothetical protein
MICAMPTLSSAGLRSDCRLGRAALLSAPPAAHAVVTIVPYKASVHMRVTLLLLLLMGRGCLR